MRVSTGRLSALMLAILVGGCGNPEKTAVRAVRQGDVTPVNWLMFHGDPQRTGWNPNETILSPATVGVGTFGQLWVSEDLDTFDQYVGAALITRLEAGDDVAQTLLLVLAVC